MKLKIVVTVLVALCLTFLLLDLFLQSDKHIRSTANANISSTKKKNSEKRTKKHHQAINTPVSDSVIYLTFDDGPNETTTPQLLEILKKEKVKATFFVTGHGPDDLIKKEYAQGHRIGLHTYTHDYATVYSSVTNYLNDLQQISDRVSNITGQQSNLVRLPGGSANTISNSYSPNIMNFILPELRKRNYQYFDWNVSAGDGSIQSSPDQPYNNVTSELEKHRDNVVLMHDTKQNSVDAVERIIDFAKANSYFALLDQNSYPAHQRE